MKRLIFAIALLALPLGAQEQKKEEPKPQEPRVNKVFVLKYVDPTQMARVLSPFGAVLSFDTSLRTLTVSASTASMPGIEEAVKRLDVPSATEQNIELTVYLLEASQIEEPGTVPKDLESVVAQLKNTFNYKTYNLADVLTLRTRTGRPGDVSSGGGSLRYMEGPPGQPKILKAMALTTQLRLDSLTIGADGTIRIERMRIGGSRTTGGGPGFNINSDVDIKPGQKVVVGKTGMTPDQAIFVVLVARVAQ